MKICACLSLVLHKPVLERQSRKSSQGCSLPLLQTFSDEYLLDDCLLARQQKLSPFKLILVWFGGPSPSAEAGDAPSSIARVGKTVRLSHPLAAGTVHFFLQRTASLAAPRCPLPGCVFLLKNSSKEQVIAHRHIVPCCFLPRNHHSASLKDCNALASKYTRLNSVHSIHSFSACAGASSSTALFPHFSDETLH